jgi:aminocarboxymuconate-semialdehyde decarboxylase
MPTPSPGARHPPTIDLHVTSWYSGGQAGISRIPLVYFADAASKDINAQQENSVREIMTTIDRALPDLDRMGIDIQVLAPARTNVTIRLIRKFPKPPVASVVSASLNLARANPNRFVGLGVLTLQEPENRPRRARLRHE